MWKVRIPQFFVLVKLLVLILYITISLVQKLNALLFLGREVVFQCRDEGPLRKPVRWVRGGGQRLPSGSTDVRGRLTIPNIQVSLV